METGTITDKNRPGSQRATMFTDMYVRWRLEKFPDNTGVRVEL